MHNQNEVKLVLKSAEAKSSSKLSFSGVVTGVNSSESDTDQVTFDDLRKNPKLQKKD